MSYKEKVLGKTKHTEKIIAIVLITVVVLGLAMGATSALIKTINEDFDMGSTSECDVGVDFYAYDPDGNIVQVPITQAPWSIGGFIVESLAVDVSWTVTGQYMVWSTLQIVGTVKIFAISYMGVATDITANLGYSTTILYDGETALSKTIPHTFLLINLLNGVGVTYGDSDGQYWNIRVEVTIAGQATDDYGEVFTDSTGVMAATYKIYEAASGFDIDGNIG
jgi:hypothetical protein